jgi:16S rRNA (uracil1498-N3)-methyltransferase
MNLILLEADELSAAGRVRLADRRFTHLAAVLRAKPGDTLAAGVVGGGMGRATLLALGADAAELEVAIDPSPAGDPPSPLPLTLVVALPRPKVLNRVVAAAASLGVKRLFLINSWRVEKSYWSTPRLDPANLRHQSLLGLEQARDTILPAIETRRLFRPFVEDELPAIAAGTHALVAHPYAAAVCPRDVRGAATLAIGPEGGFIGQEIESLARAGLTPVTIGERILRVETAIAALAGRLY